jgi:paraquat-inducible protein B
MSVPASGPRDHGEVIRGRRGFSWAWLFPLMALAAAGWMYFDYLDSLGPEIEIRFTDAPGMEEGKTPLIFRGIVAGTVTKVHLNKELEEAVVTVRLEKFAAGLAVETTDFWIERPEFTLQGATGLTSLIEGNSLHARKGTGQRRLHFIGLDASPLLSGNESGIRIRLVSEQSQPLARGALVVYRGVQVGRVREQSLTPEGQPYIDIEVDETKRSLLKSSSRFWTIPASSVTMGPGGIRVDLTSLDTLLQGAVAFDDFGVSGTLLEDGATAPLLENEALAKACGTPISITFANGRGMRAGQTRLTYLGIPVGMVTDLKTVDGRVQVIARLNPGFDFLRLSGASFTLVEPEISLKGVSGLETLLTGVVIECEPGRGSALKTSFTGRVPKDENVVVEESESGRKFRLVSRATATGEGAPVLYRDLQVGVVLEKKLTKDGEAIELVIGVQSEYAHLVRQNSVFWDQRGLRGSIGFFNINLQTAMPLPVGNGGGAIAFGTPDKSGPPASANAMFTLYDKPQREWKKWKDPAFR